MILGLDASTTVCGWSFFDGNQICNAGFLDISKESLNSKKAFMILRFLETTSQFPLISEVKLEAALSGFMGGRTSQQVIIKLARFNAVLEYILSEELKVPITLVGAMTARKKVLGKAFVKGTTAKDYVKQELPKRFPEVLKFEQKNRNGDWNVKNGDMYDAVVMSAC